MNDRSRIYLDYQASTPTDSRVLDAMLPFLREEFGNPHSGSHDFGRRAAAAIDVAREKVASLVGASPEDVIFTSGATEANNLALFGLASGWGRGRPRLLVLATEHASVIEPAKMLHAGGHELILLPVHRDGAIDLDFLESQLGAGPALVSVGAANSEIGVLQPLRAVSELCGAADAVVHSDSSQALGKVALDVYDDGIDLLTLSGHKIYGPKGVGALIATSSIRQSIRPMVVGGGQQGGLRAGTLPTALCVGLGVACEIARLEQEAERDRLFGLRARFLDQLAQQSSGVRVNGSLTDRLPGSLSLCIEGVDGLQLLINLPELAMSTGSACNSMGGRVKPSHVLSAIRLSDDEARSTIRVSFGRYTTAEEVDIASARLVDAIGSLRRQRKGSTAASP